MTPWDILGLDENASVKEVKKRYKELSKKYHPDVGGNEALFHKMKEAYDVMSDPDRLALYKELDGISIKELHDRAMDFVMSAFSMVDNGWITKVTMEEAIASNISEARRTARFHIKEEQKEIDTFNRLLKMIKKSPKNNFLKERIEKSINHKEILKNNHSKAIKLLDHIERTLKEYSFKEELEKELQQLGE